MKKSMMAMDDEALEAVTGGDYGDSNYEYENGVRLYNIGDTVEVYFTPFHSSTTRATIEAITTTKIKIAWYDWRNIKVPFYQAVFDNGCYEWVTADDIERK